MRPTVFADVTPDMTIAQEEIFGPVLSIIAYDDEDEAVEIANGTPYGLAAGVWSADQDDAVAVGRPAAGRPGRDQRRRVQRGGPVRRLHQSGYGRELGVHGLEEFLEVKALQF